MGTDGVYKEIIKHARILIVDDQVANAALIERVLRQAGYTQLMSVQDSRQVIDQFRVFRPDLIILDLMMPYVDGYAVMTQLRGWVADGTYLPILVITADVSRAARQRALSLGAKDFLTKPVDTSEAALRIYNLLETRWLYQQVQSRDQAYRAQAHELKDRVTAALREIDLVSKGESVAGRLARARDYLLEMAAAIDSNPGETTGTAGSEEAMPISPEGAEGSAAKPLSAPL